MMGESPNRPRYDFAGLANILLRYYWPVLLAAAVFLVIQWPLMRFWWSIWMKDYSYYSHGPLVPFIVAYMIWGNKHNLASAKLQTHWAGYPLMILAGVLFVVAHWTQAGTLQALVFILMIFSTILLMAGSRTARLLAVPVFFLVTMMPMASSLLDSATAKFQLISASHAARILQLTGYDAVLQGATIYSDGLPEPLVVGIPCSGLRTLISLVTFTVFFTYVVRSQWWKKGILLSLSLPLSIFINSLRIAMIGYAGFWVGTADAMHKFHDYSGYLGLIICFALLFGIAKLLGIKDFGFAPPAETVQAEPVHRRLVGGGVAGILAILVMASAGSTQLYQSPIYPTTRGHIPEGSIPRAFGQWTSQDVPIEKLVRDVLGKGDLLNRVYIDNSEYSKTVAVFVTASRDPEAFHDPHVCLPGGGSPISDDKLITISIDKPRPMTLRATKLESTGDNGQSIVIYWYMMGPDSIPRTADVWHRNRSNVVSDLVWMLLHPGQQDKLRREIENRQFFWYRFSTEVISDEASDTELLTEFIREFVANTRGFGR